MPSGTQLIPLNRLETTRARPKGIANAETFMAGAYAGTQAKRAPISLKANPDGTYTVLDGNSTTAVARKHGWKVIAAMVVP